MLLSFARKEKPYICMLCGHAFAQKNNLNMHMRIHSGEKPYQCHMCGKTFRTQGNCRCYYFVKMYQFPSHWWPHQFFFTPASLDKHHRTHTGERPFGCDICEQRFTEKGALVRHKASKHEEGRPHCCHVCSKTFKGEMLRQLLAVSTVASRFTHVFHCVVFHHQLKSSSVFMCVATRAWGSLSATTVDTNLPDR